MYKTVISLTFALLLGLLAASSVSSAGQQNADYLIERDVIAGGGGVSSGGNYILTGSIGQSSPLASISNESHVVYSGFWHGKSYTVSVAKTGTGGGTVKDCSAGTACPGERIDCGPDCLEFYAEGESVLLKAFHDADSTFKGWLVNGAPPDLGLLYITKDLLVTAEFERKPDLDNDTLSDEWEQQIIDADPNDGITRIEDVLKEGDFDGDGLTNEEEFWNEVDPTTPTEIVASITPTVSEALLLERFRVDVQLRFRHDSRPAHLVRKLIVMADGNGTFGLPNTRIVHVGRVYQDSAFPGRIYAETDSSGLFAVDARGLEGGRLAFHVEALTGGGGVVLPPSPLLQAIDTAFLTATRQGRRLNFPSGENSVEIRIADLAAAMTGISNIAEADWNLEGLTFQHVRISQQGYLLLGRQQPLTAQLASWADAPNGLVAPFFDDLVMPPESRVYVNWDLEAEPCLTVQWCRMGLARDAQAGVTFQVQMYQWSKQVRFVYTRMLKGTTDAYDGHDATIGLKYSPTAVYAWEGTLPQQPGLAAIDPSTPFVQVRLPDRDHDHLNETEEAALGTDPGDWDSDDDLMSDGWENTFRPALDPLQADAGADPDGDGYTNLIEYYLGSQPNDSSSPRYTIADTDKDGMPDAWETQYGLDPNSAADAALDSDRDWYRNVLEYVIGGDPLDPNNHGTHPFEQNGGATNATYP